jgi:hypothetical protein
MELYVSTLSQTDGAVSDPWIELRGVKGSTVVDHDGFGHSGYQWICDPERRCRQFTGLEELSLGSVAAV